MNLLSSDPGKMEFVKVHSGNTTLLESFIRRAGESLKTFRYFEKRPLSVIQFHLCTWLIVENEVPVAYGHLDKEDGVIWLGIAVADEARGKGLGKKMMQRLMDSAAAIGVQRIKLSVDHVNTAAIKLYEQFGFKLASKKETFGFYKWEAEPLRKAVISSLAFMGMKIDEVIAEGIKDKFILEFSSGMPYQENAEELFLKAPVKRFAHNYFPAPKVPFVLNLGSGDEEIRRRSIQHCIHGIELSYAVGAPFFSAHAGFCIDPKPSELGKQLSRVDSFDREKHWKLFTDSVREVLGSTDHLPTGFLLENNVLAKMNVYADGSNPLLCVEADEMLRLMDEVPDPRAGILFDTAHMKVSAQTLEFDLEKETKKILPFVRCIHHSDNDGMLDNNQPFQADYWFLPLMNSAGHAIHVLEVRKQNAKELSAMEGLLFS
ncbi:MAG TPA: GNAT family N-acetyltransferase [Bacteroidia bacterium]|jgi:RimJ/RimL family protein N-acetyltransferase/sugar phosphate isomerase/epimerase|nr:GNAT family N-acetyltransferase [Bacteroidia bacterium]